MNSAKLVFGALLLSAPALAVASAKHEVPFEPIKAYDVSHHRLDAHHVGRALKWSALSSDWSVIEEGAGSFTAALADGEQAVKVKFHHSAGEVRAEYVDSHKLGFGNCTLPAPWAKFEVRRVDPDKQCIHKAYYSWLGEVVGRLGVSAQQLQMVD